MTVSYQKAQRINKTSQQKSIVLKLARGYFPLFTLSVLDTMDYMELNSIMFN